MHAGEKKSKSISGAATGSFIHECTKPASTEPVPMSDAVKDTLRQMGDNLHQWRAVHEDMIGQTHDIPHGSTFDIVKFKGGMITTDTSAYYQSCLLRKLIVQ